MIEDCVIIGGGVAGLSAANRLADHGVRPVLIEAGSYPAHRICGEFFSYECLPILHDWQISPSSTIDKAAFFHDGQSFAFPLPSPSGSCSRYEFDWKLLERARQKGVRVYTDTNVVDLYPPISSQDHYEVVLSNGTNMQARHLFIGTGRIPRLMKENKSMPPKYYGFKAHFEGIPCEKTIRMYTFSGGYLGVSSIDQSRTNMACIVRQDCIKQGPENFLQDLEERVRSIVCNKNDQPRRIFPQWLYGQVPEFGIRSCPRWERVFWIGDAAGSIPPISGDGLAIAITSGCMAADSFLRGSAEDFHEKWSKRYHRRFFVAQHIHKVMSTSWLSGCAFAACRVISAMPSYFWKLTRE